MTPYAIPVMSRERANEILTLLKAGTDFPAHVIRLALYATGDLRRLSA
jgi:hypothetical protein